MKSTRRGSDSPVHRREKTPRFQIPLDKWPVSPGTPREASGKGIIGPSDGSRPRQVLVTEDEYYGMGSGDDEFAYDEPEAAPAAKAAPEKVKEEKPVPDEELRSMGNSAVDYFNSLPPSVQKMILDADHHEDY